MCGYPWTIEAKRGYKILWSWSTSGCEGLGVGARDQIPAAARVALLTAEPSRQPFTVFLPGNDCVYAHGQTPTVP